MFALGNEGGSEIKKKGLYFFIAYWYCIEAFISYMDAAFYLRAII